jgi:molybdopterin-guanine dinucleotide biosynthesis protein
VVAVFGARQIGKTTLARALAERSPATAAFFDLEEPQDLARFQEPLLLLRDLQGLVVIDTALKDLSLPRLDVVQAGDHTFPLAEGIRALAFCRLLEDLDPLR